MKNQHTALLSFCLAGFISCTGCKDDPGTTESNFDAAPLLKNTSENVITVTYHDLFINSQSLVTAIDALQAAPDAVTIEAARDAWRNTRKPWEQSEGFLFGPVSTKGIDPAIDSWPVNIVDLNAVISGGETLSKTFIDGLEGTLKGFHTIEYLLWGTDGTKLAEDFTDREFEYLQSLAESMQGETEKLWTSWTAEGENFQSNISDAGNGASIYPSQSSAIQELINGMIGIADEVANGKINDPLSTGDITLEESRFSSNSKTDFADNIISILNIYTGDYNGINGEGVKAFVAEFDAALAEEVETDIHQAIDAINAIPGTFTEAIISDQAAIENAQQKIIDVKVHLENDVLPLLDKL